MTRTASPLRYPGGKSALHNMVADLLVANDLVGCNYAEPFAGGGGLALSLLFDGLIGDVHLNDIDPAIGAFWRSVLDMPDEIADLIRQTPITIDEWHRQKQVYADAPSDDLTFGFSTLFLNRTNRSGIIKGAGVIGGLRQNGNYLLDCRFNKEDLIKRIKRIAKYRSRINFSQLDAGKFLREQVPQMSSDTLLCADPPYYVKGSSLYTSFYNPEDHAGLAAKILEVEIPWITTYDKCKEISQLYSRRRQYDFSVVYSAQTKRLGDELLIVSKGLKVPEHLPLTLSSSPN